MISRDNKIYRKRAYNQYDQIFQYNLDIVLPEHLQKDLASLHFMPTHCTLLKEIGGDQQKYSEYLKDAVAKMDPSGDYTMGSGFQSGTPWMDFNMVFSDLSEDLKKATHVVQATIAQQTGHSHGSYSCLHVRTTDKSSSISGSTRAWINKHLPDSDEQPLYLMSQGSHSEMAKLVGCETKRKCVKSFELMPSTQGSFGLNKRLFVELAVCASARNVYLPNALPARKIIGDSTNHTNSQWTSLLRSNATLQGRRRKASSSSDVSINEDQGSPTSTLSETIGWITTLPTVEARKMLTKSEQNNPSSEMVLAIGGKPDDLTNFLKSDSSHKSGYLGAWDEEEDQIPEAFIFSAEGTSTAME